MFWHKPKEAVSKLPKGIEEVEGGYRVKGLRSVHSTVDKAVKQLRGWKDGN